MCPSSNKNTESLAMHSLDPSGKVDQESKKRSSTEKHLSIIMVMGEPASLSLLLLLTKQSNWPLLLFPLNSKSPSSEAE